MISEDDLSCPICQSLFTDPRVLSCGHSFCCECISNWAKQSRECPVCRNSMGIYRTDQLPKNVTLSGLVDRYKEQPGGSLASKLCNKCSASNKKCTLCEHCRRSFCPSCTQLHLRKLQGKLSQKVKYLSASLNSLERGIEPLMRTHATWTQSRNFFTQAQTDLVRAQTELTACLEQINKQLEQLSSSVQSWQETVHSARASLTELENASTTDAVVLAKSIGTANELAECLHGGNVNWGPSMDVDAAGLVARRAKFVAEAVSAVAGRILPPMQQPAASRS